MRRLLVLCAAAALVAAAGADVRVFITRGDGTLGEWGLDLNGSEKLPGKPGQFWPDNHAVVTGGKGADYYGLDRKGGPLTIDEIAHEFPNRHGTFPPEDYGETPTIDLSKGEWGYIWLQFNHRADGSSGQDTMDPAGSKIVGIKVLLSGTAGIKLPTYYLCVTTRGSKWNGTPTPPNFPEGHMNPQTMVAVTATGITNSADSNKFMLHMGKRPGEPPQPWKQTRMNLLGAVDFNKPGRIKVEILDIAYNSGKPTRIWPGFADVVDFQPGDLNCDGKVNFGDINPFILALTDPPAYKKQYPDCDIMNGDINRDGKVDFADINPFIALLTGP